MSAAISVLKVLPSPLSLLTKMMFIPKGNFLKVLLQQRLLLTHIVSNPDENYEAASVDYPSAHYWVRRVIIYFNQTARSDGPGGIKLRNSVCG